MKTCLDAALPGGPQTTSEQAPRRCLRAPRRHAGQQERDDQAHGGEARARHGVRAKAKQRHAGGESHEPAGVTLLVFRPDAVTGRRLATVSLTVAFLLGGVAAWRAQAAVRRLL